MKPQVETHFFEDDGRTPNNSRLPALVVRAAGDPEMEDLASWFESRFESNDWGATWRWTVYPYHHFHSTNHEVLGVARGEATLMLGGEYGRECHVVRGDLLVIPAGVGHKLIKDQGGFQVVGGYPGGIEPDILLPSAPMLAAVHYRIAALPIPSKDPLTGGTTPLHEYWKS
jgi:uncharacterized protein YjlB